MRGLVTLMVDTAAALAKNITEQERESRSAMRMKDL